MDKKDPSRFDPAALRRRAEERMRGNPADLWETLAGLMPKRMDAEG